jgi:tetratricopeptide (TPR) repeat protein
VYFGTLGILVTIAYGFERLFKYSDFRHVVWFVFGLLIVALSTRTIVRNVDWKNEDNLWFATAKYSPSSPNNHNNLGDVYARQGDLPKAAEEFKIAIQLKPNYADAYHNLGITYQRMGQFDKAIASYQEAIRLSPILWQSYQNLSMVYFENGDYKTARDYIVRALEIDPNNPTLKQIYDKFNEDASKLGI